MNFLPIRRFTLQSSKSMAQVQAALSSVVEPRRVFRRPFAVPEKPYQGQITGTRFRIQRIINYRNSFLPVINGEIRQQLGKTYIDISMRMNAFVIAFCCAWLGIVLTISVGFITAPGAPRVMALAPLGLFL